jgi:hypothetical protein
MLVCGRCGHHNEDTARFCGSCDTYLDFSTARKTQGDEAAAQPAPPPQPPPRGAPPPEPAEDVWEAPPADAWPPRSSSRRQPEPAEPDLFGGDDDYGSLLDDLAALGYGESDRESAAATVAREAPPGWPAGGHDQPQYRDPPPQQQRPPAQQRPQPAQSYTASPAEAVLPQAVRPQRPQPPPPPAEPEPDPDAGIHAVLPGERRRESVAKASAGQAEPVATALRPGEVPCPRCGRPNARETRFCRCGHQLIAAAATPAAPAPLPTTRQAPPPWWRRLLGMARSGSYTPSGTARVQYSRALEVRTQVVRGLMVLAALGIGISFIGPFGVRTWVADQFANITQRYKAVEVREANVVGNAEEPTGFAAAQATDGQPSRAWAVGWNPEEEPVIEEPCAPVEGPAAGALAVTFGGEARVDRITVRAGIDRERKDLASTMASPKIIDVLFSDGTCKRLDLKDTFSAQKFTVEGGRSEGATVSIVDVYKAADGPGDQVALSEITFETRESRVPSGR